MEEMVAGNREYDGVFGCNICEELAHNGVVAFCGHLFCWSCLVQHLKHSCECPVCKAQLSSKKVIPIYGGRVEAAVSAPARPPPPLVTVKMPRDHMIGGEEAGRPPLNRVEDLQARLRRRLQIKLEGMRIRLLDAYITMVEEEDQDQDQEDRRGRRRGRARNI